VCERHLYQSEECRLIHTSMTVRIEQLEREIRDHAQRWDTLQTPWWKRVWFKIDGWPWYDLNGKQAWRPWNRVPFIDWSEFRLD
jgi:hypothetical protein